MKKEPEILPGTRIATEMDFRDLGYFKLKFTYWYWCYGERKYVKDVTRETTDRDDLKMRISTNRVLVDE